MYRLVADMTNLGWNQTDLARAAGVSHMTVSRFMSGESQTPKTAKKLAIALGFSIRRYIVQRRGAA